MIAYVLKKESGEYWGVNSKYKNSMIFLTEGDAWLAWENINQDLEIVQIEIKEVDKLFKIWDNS